MLKSWKALLILFGAVTFTLGIASQVLSVGLDFKAQFQQIEKNRREIGNIKCLSDKKELDKTLRADKRALRSINIDYVAKGLTVPESLREDYINLPLDIEATEDKIKKLPCHT